MELARRQSLLVISHDVVGQRMAGPGIRMWELAQALAREMPVTLIAPRPIDLTPPSGLTCGHYTWGDASSLMPYLATVPIVLANGFVAAAHPELLGYQGRLIIDLYDPIAFENFELFRQYPFAARQAQAERDVALLRALIGRGDHFLCATERQRDLYMGALLALGRLSPDLIDVDPLLQHLIAVVPFGVSDEPPLASGQPALVGVLDDLGPHHQIILWSGGLWDWMDPQTLVRAMPKVRASVPQARLVFLAGRHPGAVAEMTTPVATRQLAADLGLLGQGVHFYDDWVPYERRADFLLEATVMVSLHRDHLETRYAAVRSRVLDHFWVGRPSVLSAGDAAAELVEKHQAGEVVPVGDVDAVAKALIRLLIDQQRLEVYSANARMIAQGLRWSQIVQPVVAICGVSRAANSISSDEKRVEQMEDRLQSIIRERNELIKALETQWPITLPADVSLPTQRLRRWLTQRITGWTEHALAQLANAQREFNATVVNLMYRVASSFDEQVRQLTSLTEQLAELRPQVQTLQQELRLAQQELQKTQQELQTTRQELQEILLKLQMARDTLPPLHQHVIDLEQQMLDIQATLSLVADRLSRVSTNDHKS
ncbi:MAG: glycosyltransferase [Chloroflexus sp.]